MHQSASNVLENFSNPRIEVPKYDLTLEAKKNKNRLLFNLEPVKTKAIVSEDKKMY